MDNEGVIRFENLRQRTGVVGEYAEVTAKPKPFVSSNAQGVLREVRDHEEVGVLASAAAKRCRAAIANAD